jgi:putative DNA primase/helicase
MNAPISKLKPAVASDRRQIHLRQGDLHILATEAEAALMAADAPIFVRGVLVRPAVDEVMAAQGRRTRTARLVPATVPMLIDHFSRSADWLKYNERKKGFVPADPPNNVASTLLSRDGEWRLRPLVGAITAPTMRPDGSILAEPGYDAATRLVLMNPPAMPDVPAKPSRDDALKALALLDGLLAGFPFVDDASRAVALSALITPVVRGAMPVAPMHATTAPVAGSGKSYLTDLAAAIAIGDRAPVISAGKTEEETEKRLASALLEGMPIIAIDNVNGTLGGDALCQYVERPVVAVRQLGLSKLYKIESRATIFATGNNLQIFGDMTRRTLLCSMDPAMERPELRVFATSPLDMILAKRGHYIAAALTVVRAYLVACFVRSLVEDGAIGAGVAGPC